MSGRKRTNTLFCIEPTRVFSTERRLFFISNPRAFYSVQFNFQRLQGGQIGTAQWVGWATENGLRAARGGAFARCLRHDNHDSPSGAVCPGACDCAFQRLEGRMADAKQAIWIKDPLAILADGAERGVVVKDGKIRELVGKGGEPATPAVVLEARDHVVLPG